MQQTFEHEGLVREVISRTPVWLPSWIGWDDILQEARLSAIIALRNKRTDEDVQDSTVIFAYVKQHLLNLQQRYLTEGRKADTVSGDSPELEGEELESWNWPDYNLYEAWFSAWVSQAKEKTPKWARPVLELLYQDPLLSATDLIDMTGLSYYKVREALSFIRGALTGRPS